MWFFAATSLLWLAGEQWPAFKTFLRVCAFAAAVTGLLILLKVGFMGPFLATLFKIPIDLIAGIVGIIVGILSP